MLDHCAKPPIASGDITDWERGIRRLARHPNVTCKLSGLVTEASWTGWTAADLLPCLDIAAGAFGPERLMFGSDWPVCLLAADYVGVVAMVARWAQRLTVAERDCVFGGTAMSVYQLEDRDGP